MNHNQIYEAAISYLEYCGNDVSTSTFKIWVSQEISEGDRNRIFLCALSLVDL